MGCAHGCLYCDGRAEKYFVEGDFARNIIYRENLPQLLQKELPRLREYGPISISSGITDAYQPIEAELGITRACAEILQYFSFPVTILTKSCLVARDIDLWKRVHEQAGFLLLMTITTLDAELAALIEPGAPSPDERIACLQKFSEAGCHTGVLMMPLIPHLSDSIEQIDEMYQRFRNAGVSCLIPGGLTLRPGRQKELFMRTLEHPLLAARNSDLSAIYAELYGKELTSGNPDWKYRNNSGKIFRNMTHRHQIAPFIPHSVYSRTLNKADELFALLCQMDEWYRNEGKDTTRLRKSTEAYRNWLLDSKKAMGSTRGAGATHDMDGLIHEAEQNGSLESLIRNDRLYAYLQKVLHHGEIFSPWCSGDQ